MKKLNIIGCGNVGRTLARLWREESCSGKGVRIGQILNRSSESAGRAADFIGQGTPIALYAEFQPADIFMIGTPDDQIQSCAENLCKTAVDLCGSIIFHCSGSLSSEVLSCLKEKGAITASVHPVKSFTDPANAVKTFAGTYCAFEGDDRARSILEDLFSQIGGRLISVDPQFKMISHAGAVFACNYLVSLIDVGLSCYQKAGIDQAVAMKIIEPMVRGTIENLFKQGPARALTGPIARGDAGVVERQIETLKAWNGEAADLYKILGEFTLNLSIQQGTASAEAIERLKRVLEE